MKYIFLMLVITFWTLIIVETVKAQRMEDRFVNELLN